jgi:hypothetical protein
MSVGPGFSSMQGNVQDWDMQDLVWANLPWDWNLMDDLLVEFEQPVGERETGDSQVNGNTNGPSNGMGLPVL